MSFPRYPSYKNSGVEWLGEVPGHWEVRPLKRLARLQTGMTPPTDEWDNYIDDEGFQWIRPEDIDETGAPTKSSKFLTEKGWSQTRQIKAGASLICCIGTIGKVGITTDAVSTNQQITAAEPQQDARYLFYAICAGRSELELASTGNVLRILNTERLGNIRFTNPPLPEQVQITAFLDRETAKIDALVAEQRRLMELLKEKRQAVISHAVTRGLNPDARLMPSGIEWLGDVPAHWEVKKIKYVTASIKAGPFGSALTKDLYVRSGYRVYGQEQVIPNDFTVGDYFITPKKYEELSQYSVSPGDILISCVGTFGKIAIVPDNAEPGIINPRLIRLRCSHAIKVEYLVEVMRSNVTFEQFASFTRGGTMDVINIGTLSEIFLALPPMTEQLELLRFIQHQIMKFDTLTAEAQRAIDLLQERRTALISAAVTGQIDVRGVLY